MKWWKPSVFVIGGNVAIGLVIFIIIVLVQFYIVITKGSERVAEVSARFTLDAMPGKQMAILCADLNSGLIDEQEARVRRSESSGKRISFGSMDVEVCEGDDHFDYHHHDQLDWWHYHWIYDRTRRLYDDHEHLLRLTVGDGLMSQIPALLISVATGMIVTRSASDALLNSDVLKQFSTQPRVLILAAIAMLCLIPIGFPIIQVLILSAILAVMGILILSRAKKARLPKRMCQKGRWFQKKLPAKCLYKDLENVYGLLNVDPISMEFGYKSAPACG